MRYKTKASSEMREKRKKLRLQKCTKILNTFQATKQNKPAYIFFEKNSSSHQKEHVIIEINIAAHFGIKLRKNLVPI